MYFVLFVVSVVNDLLVVSVVNDLLVVCQDHLGPCTSAGSPSYGVAYLQSFCGQTFSTPRRLVSLTVKIGHAHSGQLSFIGAFHKA
jgi:hypothetical protein